jgi:hypothetical protein
LSKSFGRTSKFFSNTPSSTKCKSLLEFSPQKIIHDKKRKPDTNKSRAGKIPKMNNIAKNAKILHLKIVPFVPTKKPTALSSSHCNI